MSQTFNTVRKYGARVGAGALALVGTGAAMAQAVGPGAQIVTSVENAMETGQSIAVAVVLGLFAIWAIKLLWRAK